MALSRAPLTELSSQGLNRRKMNQQTYGKRRRAVVPQAPLWESPDNSEGRLIDESKTPIPKTSQDAEAEDNCQKSSTLNLETTGCDERADRKKPSIPILRTTDDDDTEYGCETPLKSNFETPLHEETGGSKDPSAPTGDPVYAEDQLITGVKNLALASQSVKTKAQPARKRANSVPTKRATRGCSNTHLSRAAPLSEVDVAILLAESDAHTKDATKPAAEITAFHDFGAKLSKHFDIKKLSDGSFGDVYKLIPLATMMSTSKGKLESLGGGVLKIIPLASKTGPGSRSFSRVESVLSEVRVLRALDSLHGMTRFRDVHVVVGRYPDTFIKAYTEFSQHVRTADAPNPTKFTESQTYAIIDMDDAGIDIASLDSISLFQAYDIFWETAIILANAEREAEFEARDMHNGNICVKSTLPGRTMEIPDAQLSTWAEDQVMRLGQTGIRVTLIDYTLSRARLNDNTVAFQDLKHARFLFTRSGHKPASIQQRAYDQMRDAVRAASAKTATTSKKEDWELFVPSTNVVWLYYLLDLFLNHNLWVPEASNRACIRAQHAVRQKLEGVLMELEAGASGGEGACVKSAGDVLDRGLESGVLGWEEVEEYLRELESEQ